ncbi:hypothetical protein BY996DRAFT_6677430, partial [Phakopsora pachyrhizi]
MGEQIFFYYSGVVVIFNYTVFIQSINILVIPFVLFFFYFPKFQFKLYCLYVSLCQTKLFILCFILFFFFFHFLK